MTYVTTPLERFGGLNLRDKVDAVGPAEALSCRNVQFTDRGAVTIRDGEEQFTAATLTNPAQSLHPHYRAAGTPQLLAGCGTRLEALSNTGTLVASRTGLTDGIWDFARFGTPNAESAYAGNGNAHGSTVGLVSWAGTAWATHAATPAASALAVMAVSNRMVAGGFNTTTGGPDGSAGSSSPSHVYFSDPGTATTWDTSNFIQVTPGDGERVQAVIPWREFVFIFKESKFFVVHGETVDNAGGPIFNYYAVDTGVGLASPRAVAADETGVYFMDRKGVYRTTGNEPEQVSLAVEPIFFGRSTDFFSKPLNADEITECTMAIWEDRLYLSYPDITDNFVLVYDTHAGWWSHYKLDKSAGKSDSVALAVFRPDDTEMLVFSSDNVGGGSENHVYRHGVGIAFTGTSDTHWQGGYSNYGNLDLKTIRETKVVGTGTANIGVAVDYDSAAPSTASLDMTSSGSHALVARMDRRAKRGAAFSVRLSSLTGAVHEVVHHLREQGIPSRTAGSVIE